MVNANNSTFNLIINYWVENASWQNLNFTNSHCKNFEIELLETKLINIYEWKWKEIAKNVEFMRQAEFQETVNIVVFNVDGFSNCNNGLKFASESASKLKLFVQIFFL